MLMPRVHAGCSCPAESWQAGACALRKEVKRGVQHPLKHVIRRSASSLRTLPASRWSPSRQWLPAEQTMCRARRAYALPCLQGPCGCGFFPGGTEGVYLACLSTRYAYTTALQHHPCPPPRICFCRSARTALHTAARTALTHASLACCMVGSWGRWAPEATHVCCGRPCPAHRRTAPGPA
jgi:hypothetical protein